MDQVEAYEKYDALTHDEIIRNEQLEAYLSDAGLQSLYYKEGLVELMLNDDSNVWAEFNGEPMRKVGRMSPFTAASLISLVADSLGDVVTKESPIVEGEFPLDGSRFEGILPPVARRPTFNIRKFFSTIITLASHVESGAMPVVVYDAIRHAIEERLNILVVGGTSSGKTTLMNSIIHEMSLLYPDDRLVITENTRELQSSSPNTLFLRTTATVTKQMLLQVNMRTRPDRLLDGEVRGGEALDLLMMWNTGHPGGVCTIHADSAPLGLTRMGQLIAIASKTPMPDLIGDSVDLILFLKNSRGVRTIREVVRCLGYDMHKKSYELETIYVA